MNEQPITVKDIAKRIAPGATPAEHKRILLLVAEQLGIADAIDRSATDVSRFFYRPRCPENQFENYVFREIDPNPGQSGTSAYVGGVVR